jgi:hypothetical protein
MSRTVVPHLGTFFYINHHDRLTQQQNDTLMDHFKKNRMPEEAFTLTNAIKVDTNDETANKLMQKYNKLIEEQGIRKWGSDYAENDLYEAREKLINMAQDSKNKAVNFTKIIEPIQPYGKNWKDYLPPRVKEKLEEREDPRLLEEQANVAGIMGKAFAKPLERYGHKPPTVDDDKPPPPPTPTDTPAGGYKKSYGKKKKTKKTRRKTKNMRRKSKTKTKTKKKSTRKKKHYKKRKSKTHKKR